MTTEIMTTIQEDTQQALAKITASEKFEGMTLQYLTEVYDGLVSEHSQEVADNFAHLLKAFAGSTASSDLDAIGYGDLEIPDDMFGDDDAEELTAISGGGEPDPARNVKLTQALTKGLPKDTGQGVLFDSLANRVVARTWDDTDARPVRTPVYTLAWHQSRVFFEKGKTAPTCSSKDGTINRFGGLCSQCPMRQSQEEGKSSPCTNQINAVMVNSDLKNLFKYGFSKTGLKDGQRLAKQHQAQANSITTLMNISAKKETGELGEWYVLTGQVTPQVASPSMGKALNILSQAYVAFFKRMKTSLLQRHQTAKAQGNPALPGNVAPLALQAPSVSKAQSISNANAALLGSGVKKAEYKEPDLSSIGDE